jgi:hypothetical protein
MILCNLGCEFTGKIDFTKGNQTPFLIFYPLFKTLFYLPFRLYLRKKGDI